MGKQGVNNDSSRVREIRLWPGILIVVLQWFIRFVLPMLISDPVILMISVFGGFLGGLAVFIWWGFFSRAEPIERWGAVGLMLVTLIIASQLTHKSIATGMMGLMFFIYAIPVLSLAFVIWAVLCRRLSTGIRRIMLVIIVFLACGIWTLVRSDGITGEAGAHLTWRWIQTAEDRLLSQLEDEPMIPLSPDSIERVAGDWPGFRGPHRDAVVRGIQIKTDWNKTPPVEIWRRAVGPGCSSIAVRGDLIYTQEQRGSDEVVVCYQLSTGKPVWIHRNRARFWDSHVGAGPRATPTLNGDRVYTLGATGILNVLDAYNGSVIWSRNAASDTGSKLPGWAYSGSPLVVDEAVIAPAAGNLIAYRVSDGELLWSDRDGGDGYSSPILFTIQGITQILMMNQTGLVSFKPDDGKILWKYSWPGVRILQPTFLSDGEFLLNASETKGMRLITVRYNTGAWSVKEKWSTAKLKPNHNDVVVHKGHAYGFTGPNLVSIDMATGRRNWKGRRYGGQLLLFADQDLLVILSEKGELVLAGATPDQFRELARLQGIRGKTWNHPALAGDILLVRNTSEMAAFRLPVR